MARHGCCVNPESNERTADGPVLSEVLMRGDGKLNRGVGWMVAEKLRLIAPHHGDVLAELGKGEPAGFGPGKDGFLDIWGEKRELHQPSEVGEVHI